MYSSTSGEVVNCNELLQDSFDSCVVGQSLTNLFPNLNLDELKTSGLHESCSLLLGHPVQWSVVHDTGDSHFAIGTRHVPSWQNSFLQMHHTGTFFMCKKCNCFHLDDTIVDQLQLHNDTNYASVMEDLHLDEHKHMWTDHCEKLQGNPDINLVRYYTWLKGSNSKYHLAEICISESGHALTGFVTFIYETFAWKLLDDTLNRIPYPVGIHFSPSEFCYMNSTMMYLSEFEGESSERRSLFECMDKEAAEKALQQNMQLLQGDVTEIKQKSTYGKTKAEVKMQKRTSVDNFLLLLGDDPETVGTYRSQYLSASQKLHLLISVIEEVSYLTRVGIVLYSKTDVVFCNKRISEDFLVRPYEFGSSQEFLDLICHAFINTQHAASVIKVDVNDDSFKVLPRIQLTTGRFVELTNVQNKSRTQPPVRILVVQDITDWIIMEKELRVARNSATESNRSRGQFLALMSHNLFTPLTSILSAAETLEMTQPTESSTLIVQESKKLHGMLQNMLNLSGLPTISTSKHTIKTSANVVAITDSLVAMLQPRTEDLLIFMYVDPRCDVVISTIPAHFRTIMFSLLSNALKYTDKGHIKVKILCRELTDNVTDMVCEVSDTGKGIDEETIRTLFQDFQVGDPTQHEGMGVSLALSNKLTKELGTHLEVESELGHGSCFHFTLSATRPKLGLSSPEYITILRGMRCILVARDRSTLYIQNLSEQLSMLSIVVHFQDSDDPVLLRDDVRRLSPVVVFIESQMFRILHNSTALATVRIILVTDPSSSVEPVQSFGDNMMSIPATYSALLSQLLRSEQIRHITEDPTLITGNWTVLVVDDSPTILKTVSRLLKVVGCTEVYTASSGPEALAVYVAKHQEISLVLMDYRMKPWDGFETTKRMRDYESQNGLQGVTVITLTADLTLETINACLTVTNGFLGKPVEKKRLVGVLNSHFARLLVD
ncbi:hypothetical protein GEMRC1_003041 [Eukaryota sp. GEM-RC1]